MSDEEIKKSYSLVIEQLNVIIKNQDEKLNYLDSRIAELEKYNLKFGR